MDERQESPRRLTFPQFPKAFDALMQDPDIDMVLAIIATPYAVMRYIDTRGSIAEEYFGDIEAIRNQPKPKPFLICVVSHDGLVDRFKRETEPRIPVFTSPEMPTRALAALWQLQRYRLFH